MKQLQTKVSHCEKELEEKRTQLLSTREKASAIESELNAKRKDVEKVKNSLNSLSYDENLMEALQKVCFLLVAFMCHLLKGICISLILQHQIFLGSHN